MAVALRQSGRRLACLVLVMTAVGCVKDQDYYDIAKAKQASMEELVEILQNVKDGPSMAEAKQKLQANTDKYEAIARRAESLPKPPPRVEERFRQDSALMDATIRRLRVDVGRVAQLPGGAEFLRQFQSTKGLLTAVQP